MSSAHQKFINNAASFSIVIQIGYTEENSMDNLNFRGRGKELRRMRSPITSSLI